MRLRLWHQLFLLNAALVIAALAGVLWVQQQAFRRGLLDYLNHLDQQRTAAIAAAVAAHYRDTGGWDQLRYRPRVWLMLVGAELGGAPPADDPARMAGPDPRAPGPRGWPGEGAPPRLRPEQRPLAPGPPGLGQRPRPGGTELPARLVLLDTQGQHVAGFAIPEQADYAVPVSLDGHVIGQLKLVSLPRLRGGDDLEFVRAQAMTAFGAGGVALVLALLASVAFGARLLAPLRRVTEGARRLAAGDYAARVDVGQGEIGVLGHDFNRLAMALEQASQARRQWVADISHELRTPLAILRGEIHALEDGVRSYSPAALASLRVEADRLAALIDDLYQLALADVGALSYHFALLDLGVLLRDSVESHAEALRSRGLALELQVPDEPMHLDGDAQRLAQLLDNLLTNAARYTDTGGRVRIQAQRSGQGWLLHVDDTPPGVPAADLPRLFERLFRSEGSRNRDCGGAGLGLAICKGIVVAHCGDISASPSPLGGLRISVYLPIVGRR
ncbi:MAG: HAMP domain-containing protein [Rhodanobacteraceae bacterium]|nr:HAMP domain-containing protein [Rhodanobacteraceae bacterium]